MEVAKAALVPTVPTSPVSTPPSTQILQTTDQPGSERPLLSDTPPCQDSPADFCKIFSWFEIFFKRSDQKCILMINSNKSTNMCINVECGEVWMMYCILVMDILADWSLTLFIRDPPHHGPEYLDQRNYPDKPTPTSLSTLNSAATTTDQWKCFISDMEVLI